MSTLPSKKQWLQLFRILNKKEKVVFLVLLGLFFLSCFSLIITLYVKNTEIQPAVGGKFTEGIVGSPRFINPVYAVSNDADRDLVEIIFSGLMKYDQQGQIVPEMAKRIEIKDEGRLYEVYLKENIFWHDGEKLTADDIIFTLKTIQNPDYKSPLRGNYLGIEAEKINDHLIFFSLRDPYAGFEERLTFKIIPRHIWQNISPQNFFLSKYNLEPIGSGPYKFKSLTQDRDGFITSLSLIRFDKYFTSEERSPYLSEINFHFFESEKKLFEEVRAGKIDGFSPLERPVLLTGFEEYSFSLPRYFAVFLNLGHSDFLAKKIIRQALNYGTDKELLVEEFGSDKKQANNYYPFDLEKAEELFKAAGLEKKDGRWVETTGGKIVEFKSELREKSSGTEVTALQICLAADPEVYPEGRITGYFGEQTKKAVIKFQEKYAEEILEPWGFKSGTGMVGETTRIKLNEVCSDPSAETMVEFTLLTAEDPLLEKVAEELSRQWKNLGIGLSVESYPISQLEKDFIKPREYEMLLLGQILNIIPDPFPFWHSSQIKDPGLNLSKYENRAADKLLENARTASDPDIREEKFQAFYNILIEDAPAVFLFSPDYLYLVSQKIKGVEADIIADPSKRLANIENWYTKTKRSWR